MTATAIDANQTRVANRGHIYIAPKGSTVPGDTSNPWDAAWMDLGYTDEKGVMFSKKDSKTPVKAWQTISPIRQIVTERDLHFVFTLQQWNKVTFPLWAGEGASAVVPNGVVAGEYKMGFKPSPAIDERMLGIEWTDDLETVTHRLIVPRGCITDSVDIPIGRTGAVALGITFQALAIDAVSDLATVLMKDPAMAP